jgi:dephospho-CoA kinase
MNSGEPSHEPRAALRWHHGANPVIGLTGGVASGKSAVAALLAQRGRAVIDADKVGHLVLDLADVQQKLVDRFGSDIMIRDDGSDQLPPRVDRRALGAIVFSDPEARRALEAIVHPLMRARFAQSIDQAHKNGQTPVLDAALLFEAGWNELCDVVVYVDAPRRERARRAAANRGWSTEVFEARERAQWPCEEKRSRADVVIRNDRAADALDREVLALERALAAEAEPDSQAQALDHTPDAPRAAIRNSETKTGSGAWHSPCLVL